VKIELNEMKGVDDIILVNNKIISSIDNKLKIFEFE